MSDGVVEFAAERRRFDLMFEAYELVSDVVTAVERMGEELGATEPSRYRRATERAFPRLFDAKLDAEIGLADRARFQSRIDAMREELRPVLLAFIERKVALLRS